MDKTGYVASLVIKFLKNELIDPNEQRDFQDWLSADKSHEAFIKELENYSAIEQDFLTLRHFDTDGAWDEMRKNLSRPSFKLWRSYWPRIAVLILFLLSISIWLYTDLYEKEVVYHDDKIVEDVSGKYHNDVLPADNAAKLILADGSTLSVKDNNVVIVDGVIQLLDGEHVYEQDKQTSEPIYHTLVVPRASFFQIVLPDGTKVWLNAMSQLHFPSEFIGNERHVQLEGEGYFEVAEDKEKPFFVDVAGSSVRVLGTHFNVNAFKGITKTTLVQGSVQINAKGVNQLLVPGQEAQVDNNGIYVKKADVQKAISWKNGEFVFKADNIAYIANQLGAWYDLDIRLKSDVALNKRYSGKINRQSTLTEALEILSYVSDLAFEVRNKKLVISVKK